MPIVVQRVLKTEKTVLEPVIPNILCLILVDIDLVWLAQAPRNIDLTSPQTTRIGGLPIQQYINGYVHVDARTGNCDYIRPLKYIRVDAWPGYLSLYAVRGSLGNTCFSKMLTNDLLSPNSSY